MLAAGLSIGTIDLSIIVVYLVGIVALGCWAGLRQRQKLQGEGYFLAGKTLTWPVIGLALFSTNISTVHLVSLAEEGYKNGLAYGNFEWMAPFILIVCSLFFAPFYLRAQYSYTSVSLCMQEQ
jgi:SSS family solute:Na+ symporter